MDVRINLSRGLKYVSSLGHGSRTSYLPTFVYNIAASSPLNLSTVSEDPTNIYF